MGRRTHPGCRLWAAVSDAKVPGSGQHLTSIESYLTRTSSLSSELSYPPTEQDHPMYGLVSFYPRIEPPIRPIVVGSGVKRLGLLVCFSGISSSAPNLTSKARSISYFHKQAKTHLIPWQAWLFWSELESSCKLQSFPNSAI